MIEREGYVVSMDQVLNFSRESFGRLMAVLELQGLVPSDIPRLNKPQDADIPKEVLKLVTFLQTQPQSKLYVRHLEKPVTGVGVKCIAVRSQALTKANVGDLKSTLIRLQVGHASKGNIKFLSKFSDTPYYKAGVKSKEGDGWKKTPEGKYTSSTALVMDSSAPISGILNKIIEEQTKVDCYYSNGSAFRKADAVDPPVGDMPAMQETVPQEDLTLPQEKLTLPQENLPLFHENLAVPQQEKLAVSKQEKLAIPQQEKLVLPQLEKEALPQQDKQALAQQDKQALSQQDKQALPLLEKQVFPQKEKHPMLPQQEELAIPHQEKLVLPQLEKEALTQQDKQALAQQDKQALPQQENLASPQHERHFPHEKQANESIDRDPSTGFRGWTLNEVEDEFDHEVAPPVKKSREAFCRCNSKCMRKPYCRCKKMSIPCCAACHPNNRKCINK